MTRLLLAAALLALAVPAFAQPYVGLGLGSMKTGDVKNSTPHLVAGWRFGTLGAELSHFEAAGVTGTGVAAVGNLSLGGGFSLLGKLGAYSVKVERSSSTSRNGPPPTTTNYGMLPAVGVGVGYAFNERVSLRAMLDHVDGKDDLDRVRLFSLGVLLRF